MQTQAPFDRFASAPVPDPAQVAATVQSEQKTIVPFVGAPSDEKVFGAIWKPLSVMRTRSTPDVPQTMLRSMSVTVL